MELVTIKIIQMLVAGLLFGSLFLVKKKYKSLLGWGLIAYLIYLGVTA